MNLEKTFVLNKKYKVQIDDGSFGYNVFIIEVENNKILYRATWANKDNAFSDYYKYMLNAHLIEKLEN